VIDNLIIRKIADYLYLNACSVNSSGLFNGKAGFAISIFETARLLKDEYFEEKAFELLQESLLSKNKDVGFENGLPGIGFVLIYLIENEFVDGDFNDLFSSIDDKIRQEIDYVIKSEQQKIGSLLPIVTYLEKASDISKGKKYDEQIRVILAAVENELNNWILTRGRCQKSVLKPQYLNLLKNYLKISFNHCLEVDISLLMTYCQRYEKGDFISDYVIGSYIFEFAKQQKEPYLTEIGQQNMKLAENLLSYRILTLSKRIEILYHKIKQEGVGKCHHDFNSSGFKFESEESFERNVLKLIHQNSFIPGFEAGIARLLFFIVFLKTVSSNHDTSRFNLIF